MAETFGQYVRRRRGELKIGLRATAAQLGISGAHLSRLETGVERSKPSEKLVRNLAVILDDDFDKLMRLAGRMEVDLQDYVAAAPRMPEFLRRARDRGISADKLIDMLEKAES